MYLGYNWLITQKTLPINAFFVNSKLWLQVMFTYQHFFLVLAISLMFSQVIYPYLLPSEATHQRVLYCDISQYITNYRTDKYISPEKKPKEYI